MNRSEQRTRGHQSMAILGWTCIVLGVLTAIWGFKQYPGGWWTLDWTTYMIGFAVLAAVGLIFLHAPVWLSSGGLILTLAFSVWFVVLADMPLMVKLMSIVVEIAIAVWLILLILHHQ